MLTFADVQYAWAQGQQRLAKGQAASPGLPVAPKAPHQRAPRPHADELPGLPAEAQNPHGAVYMFKPHRLGDLARLHLQDAVPSTPQRSARTRVNAPPVRTTLRHISSLLRTYRPGYGAGLNPASTNITPQ